MAEIEGGGGAASSSEELALYGKLKKFLGSYFMENEGTPLADVLKVNLYRLRALYERRGNDRYVKDVRQLAYSAGARGLFDDLFGREGKTERVPRSDEARLVVDNQAKAMEEQAQTQPKGTPTDSFVTGVMNPSRLQEVGAPAEHPEVASTTGDLSKKPGLIEGDAPILADAEDRVDNTQEAADAATDLQNAATGGTTGTGSGSGSGSPSQSGSTSGLPPAYGGGIRGLPPGAEVWNVDGTIMVAYTIEKGDPESGYVMYGFKTPEAFQTAFPGGVTGIRELTQEEADTKGALFLGSTNLLRADLEKGWEEGFYSQVGKAMKLQPWLEDPEVLATILGATLEGRSVSESELEATEYFATRSDAEIQYVAFASKEAGSGELESYHAKWEDAVRKSLEKAGVYNPNETVVEFMARRAATGEWNEADLSRQIIAVANPYSDAARNLDDDLAQVIGGVEMDTLSARSKEVRDTVRMWLGPLANSWSDEQVRSWAGAIADDESGQAQIDLVESLQKQRVALFPEYDNPNLSYDDISAPWKQYMANQWGESVNALDEEVLHKVIRANDVMEAGKILRGEGMKRGNKKIELQAANEMMSAFGGSVVNPL